MNEHLLIIRMKILGFYWRHKGKIRRRITVMKHRILNRILERLYGKSMRSYQRWLYRQKIFAKTNHRCIYCGTKRHLTVDHVFPKSRGGSSRIENKVAACKRCNNKKGSALPNFGSESFTTVKLGDLLAYKQSQKKK